MTFYFCGQSPVKTLNLGTSKTSHSVLIGTVKNVPHLILCKWFYVLHHWNETWGKIRYETKARCTFISGYKNIKKLQLAITMNFLNSSRCNSKNRNIHPAESCLPVRTKQGCWSFSATLIQWQKTTAPYIDYVWVCNIDRAKGLEYANICISDQACASFVNNISYDFYYKLITKWHSRQKHMTTGQDNRFLSAKKLPNMLMATIGNLLATSCRTSEKKELPNQWGSPGPWGEEQSNDVYHVPKRFIRYQSTYAHMLIMFCMGVWTGSGHRPGCWQQLDL